ncbi:MAG TPA: hypothetical protein ENK72_01115 [Epsilonproteobacteria bacterium]|nr:hypothetical protein [Campylobacterota bacterium]
MKRIVLLLLCATLTVSSKTDIEALKAYKRQYKSSLSKSKKEIQTVDIPLRVVVILKSTGEGVVEEMAGRFGLKLERCLVGRVCIFENNVKWELALLASKLKQLYPSIDTVRAYKKPDLQPY